MHSDSVERYYDENPTKEWDRLEVRHDRVEYEVTLRALAEFLPHAPARILDIGGGPGRYAIALTQRGYSADAIIRARTSMNGQNCSRLSCGL